MDAREMKDAAEELIGVAMADVRARLRAHARGTAPVLITGEHGTGKRVTARALHALSERAAAPFIGLDCDVCTETGFQSELCGLEMYNCWSHSGGPRTSVRPGRLEKAAGGTLYLWHLSELAPSAQRLLLRLIKEKTFERLNSSREIKVDVRVVATTCRPLPDLVKTGEFLFELAECFEPVQLVVPPLRERMRDLGSLVNRFLSQHEVTITQEALDQLATMTWYENVADLEDFLAPIVVRSGPGSRIDEAMVRNEPPLEPPTRLSRAQRAAKERAIAQEAVRKAGGSTSVAAEALGMSVRKLQYLLSETQ